MTFETPSIIGVGSPIVDIVTDISEETLARVPGGKGGMILVDAAEMNLLEQLIDEKNHVMTPGGSAGNTVFALARAGIYASMLGKLGNDTNGAFYRDTFASLGGDTSRFRVNDTVGTAACISMVTPDHERTMRTHLGAAATLDPSEVQIDDFAGIAITHIEGYLLFNPALMTAVLNSAKEAGSLVSLDLGSYEVVEASNDILPGLLEEYVDIVYANEDEAKRFCGEDDPKHGLMSLASVCRTAVVNMGADGSLITDGDETIEVAAIPVKRVVDTTGAGDYWAAGFLYGRINGQPLGVCGQIGALFGSSVVQVMGAKLPEPMWERILKSLPDKT